MVALLDAHGVYLSEADEARILESMTGDDDVADLALRTCLCGKSVDGFDEYHTHLRQVILASPSSAP